MVDCPLDQSYDFTLESGLMILSHLVLASLKSSSSTRTLIDLMLLPDCRCGNEDVVHTNRPVLLLRRTIRI